MQKSGHVFNCLTTVTPSEERARGQDFPEFRSEVDDYENGSLVQNGVSLVITQPGYHWGEPVPSRITELVCI